MVNLLRIINKQIEIVKSENISETDKDYFLSLIKHQYDSKIQQSIRGFEKYKRSKQNFCNGCNQKHGIPDEIFNESDRIVTNINELKGFEYKYYVLS